MSHQKLVPFIGAGIGAIFWLLLRHQVPLPGFLASVFSAALLAEGLYGLLTGRLEMKERRHGRSRIYLSGWEARLMGLSLVFFSVTILIGLGPRQ